jgi:putative peptidoglycan lipid II flippase
MLLARLGFVAREMAVAAQFGRADEVEAFVMAYLLPAFLVSVVGTSFSAAFIPTYVQVRDTQGRAAAQQLLGSASGWTLLALSLALAALCLAAPWVLPALASRFDPAKVELTQGLLYVLAPFAVLGAMAAVWSAVLNAEQRFVLPALAPLLEPLAAVVALFACGGAAAGIVALAAGTVIGAGLQALAVGVSVARSGVSVRPRLAAPDRHSTQMLLQYVPMLAAALIISATTLVDHAMAAALEAGSVAAFTYGRKVVDALAGLGALALGTVLLPGFSQRVAQADWAGCRRALRSYSAIVFLALVPLSALLIGLSMPIVEALFERGRFTSADSGIVARVQTLYALQIPFYVAATVGIRMIWALRRNVFFVYANLGVLALKIALNLLFMPWLGIAGIALASSVAYLISSSAIYFYARAELARAARS